MFISKKIINNLNFNTKKQQAFLEDIASLISDGVNIKEAVTTLESIYTGINKQVATELNRAFAQGQSFSDGLGQWFPNSVIEIIRAGENSGTFANAVLAATNALKNQTHIFSTLITLITYPSIVLSLSLILLVVIKNTVLTNFAAIKPLSQWPSQGASLYHFAGFIEYWWWSVLIGFTLISIIIYKFLTTYTGPARARYDTLPLVTLYRDSTAARFMQILGLLISNGITIKKALSIMSIDAQPYLTWHLANMEDRLSGGIDNIAEVLDTKLLRSEDLIRLKVVAKGKGFAAALISLAEQAQKRNSQTTHFILRITGAFLLIGAAIIAANIIFGIYAVGATLT